MARIAVCTLPFFAISSIAYQLTEPVPSPARPAAPSQPFLNTGVPQPLPPTQPFGSPGLLQPIRPPSIPPGAVSSFGVLVSASRAPDERQLVWDSEVKDYKAKPGEVEASLSFSVTNLAEHVVAITGVRTSCGCTVAKLPKTPWVLEPDESGKIDVTVDLRGKRGLLTKLVSVDTSVGFKVLTVRVDVPEIPGMANQQDRGRNLLIATVDRQAVFKNDCASCHATPTVGKTGAALYAAACGVCHDAEHRATMVTDLRTPKEGRNFDYWRNSIANGKPGSLMPAFAKAMGGPLTDEQITDLAKLLAEGLPPPPPAGAQPAATVPLQVVPQVQ